MYVHFYPIRGCTCDNVDNKPVLIAPPGVPLYLLRQYEFMQLEDGRWCHFLTMPEYEYVMTGYPDRDVTCPLPTPTQPPAAPQLSPEEIERRGKQLGTIGLAMLGCSIVLLLLYICTRDLAFGEYTDTINQYNLRGCFMTFIASFVLMVILRTKHRGNQLGKILFWCILGVIVLFVFLLIAAIGLLIHARGIW